MPFDQITFQTSILALGQSVKNSYLRLQIRKIYQVLPAVLAKDQPQSGKAVRSFLLAYPAADMAKVAYTPAPANEAVRQKGLSAMSRLKRRGFTRACPRPGWACRVPRACCSCFQGTKPGRINIMHCPLLSAGGEGGTGRPAGLPHSPRLHRPPLRHRPGRVPAQPRRGRGAAGHAGEVGMGCNV